jgi:hypothetical protein
VLAGVRHSNHLCRSSASSSFFRLWTTCTWRAAAGVVRFVPLNFLVCPSTWTNNRWLRQQQPESMSASVLPVRVGDSGVALESVFQEGVKWEVLRSLCQLVNASELTLEV